MMTPTWVFASSLESMMRVNQLKTPIPIITGTEKSDARPETNITNVKNFQVQE